MDIQKLDQTYVANTYARFPVTIVKGKGSLVWDDAGKEYIDLSTGIAVDIFGVADEQWMAAVTAQLGTLQHISNLFYTGPCAQLAQMLCEKPRPTSAPSRRPESTPRTRRARNITQSSP